MRKRVDKIVYRRLTDNDFDKINADGSPYPGGGGQSYIDFPVGNVSIEEWTDFLGPLTSRRAGGRPAWTVSLNSIGLVLPIDLIISNRRPASVAITSQKINSAQSNRVPAWHPDHGFPSDVSEGDLFPLIYIVKTIDSEFWAGWIDSVDPDPSWPTIPSLSPLFTSNDAGIITCDESIHIDTSIDNWPFYFSAHKTNAEEVCTANDFEEDILEELSSSAPEVIERVIKLKARNTRIVKQLKRIYNGQCQISGSTLTFLKTNGEFYSEAHHLIPLGDGGSDDYMNIIIVSPLIHKMLHYANVSTIDLNNIEDNHLTIQINDSDYSITWHPEHARIVENALRAERSV